MIEFKALPKVFGQFKTEIAGVTKFFSAYGVFNVSGMKLISAPNSIQEMSLTVYDPIDLNKPSILDYLA